MADLRIIPADPETAGGEARPDTSATLIVAEVFGPT